MRHAFLIMAHNEPEILDILMDKLSHIDGQVFVHIDKKVKGQMFDSLSRVVSLHHGILLAKRVNVVWGDYSQIACELALFQEAVRGALITTICFLVSICLLNQRPISANSLNCKKDRNSLR